MENRSIDRRCPRCGGKILIDKDFHGWYEQCLQCSYMHDLVPVAAEVKRSDQLILEEIPELSDTPVNTYH